MKKLLTIFLLISVQPIHAQNPPAFRQFYFNPFLFNPAYAGIDGYSELFVYHRQQWLNFNNAPSASGFNLQYPTQNRAAYGFTFTTQEVVAMRNSSAMLSFAYRVPFSPTHYLSFGISGGIGSNNLATDDKDYSNDPTVVSAASNAIYADGNFGFLYTLSGLRIGFALPRLFGQKYFSPQDLGDTRFAQLRNQLYSISYKFYFGSGNFALEPYGLYRMNRDLQNFWEASLLFYVKDKIWIGGSYNETQGAGFFFGVDVKEKLRVGYSYELPPVSKDFITANSHELHVQIRMGKKKLFKWAARDEKPGPVVAKVDTQPTLPKEEEIQVSEPINVLHLNAEPRKDAATQLPAVVEGTPARVEPEPETPKAQIVQPAKTENTQDPVVRKTVPRQGVLAKGHYLIVGTFGSSQNAQRDRQRLINLGYDDTYTGQSPVNRMFYVYIFSSTDLEVVRQARQYYRQQYTSRDSWILTID